MVPSIAEPVSLLASSSSSRRFKRVLLVDDDPLVLQLFTSILVDAGYQVEPCSSAVAAVEKFRTRRRFDVLMTDFQMPVMTGVRLANLLTGVARKLPVLIISGSAAEEIPLLELWRKHWCFLPKPTNAALLLKTLDQLCGLIPIQMAEVSVMPERLMVAKN